MKIIDRYVISSFLKNYAIALMVLLGLYVVLDMVFNFDDLVEYKVGGNTGIESSFLTVIGGIFSYYFYQGFMFFVQLSGIIPVVAAAFTLMKFARFNELSAIMAAGIPLQRVALPVVLIGAVVNLVLLPVNQELIIPQMIPKLMRKVSDLHRIGGNTYTVTGVQDEQNRLLSVGRYTPPSETEPAKMEYVDVLERDEDWRIVAHTSADSATWDERNGQWTMTNGKRVTGIRPDERDQQEELVSAYKGSITPQELAIYRRGQYMDLLSTRQINEMLQRPKVFGAASLLRVKHMRFTQPLMNVILLLLAIPCILTREPNRLNHAAGLCLAVTGLCMGSVFLCQQMANVNLLGPAWSDSWPALMAWLPILIWGPIAVWLLDRVKT